jgi:hypothetical protein
MILAQEYSIFPNFKIGPCFALCLQKQLPCSGKEAERPILQQEGADGSCYQGTELMVIVTVGRS